MEAPTAALVVTMLTTFAVSRSHKTSGKATLAISSRGESGWLRCRGANFSSVLLSDQWPVAGAALD